MNAVYRMADLNIEIDSIYKYVHLFCSDYRFAGLPTLTVHTAQNDIEMERKLSAREDERSGRKQIEYPDYYLESVAAYRQIAELLPAYDGFVFHGSAIAVARKGYIFTAKSGMGKSTHTGLWLRMLGRKARIVNDDKPIVRMKRGRAFVYGTPWSGAEQLNTNASVPLKAICVLERADRNTIREITKSEALPMLIQQAYRPSNPAMMENTLALLDRLDVRLYRLGCNMDISAAELSYNTMSQAEGEA